MDVSIRNFAGSKPERKQTLNIVPPRLHDKGWPGLQPRSVSDGRALVRWLYVAN
jgi:hypothetical protein